MWMSCSVCEPCYFLYKDLSAVSSSFFFFLLRLSALGAELYRTQKKTFCTSQNGTLYCFCDTLICQLPFPTVKQRKLQVAITNNLCLFCIYGCACLKLGSTHAWFAIRFSYMACTFTHANVRCTAIFGGAAMIFIQVLAVTSMGRNFSFSQNLATNMVLK